MQLKSRFSVLLIRLAGVAVLAAVVGSGAGGCTTAAVATAGTMVGLAASAVSTGADVYRMGKLDSADQAHYDQWLGAVRAAAADLNLTIKKETDNGKGVWRCTLVDERKTTVGIAVERRTETLCRTRVDVGVFGSEPTARLILTRIRVHGEAIRPTASTQPATLPTSG